jgi:hypothetical protein
MRKSVTSKLNSMEIFDKIHRAILELQQQDDFFDIVSVVNVVMRGYNMATIWYKVREMPMEDDDEC